MQESTMKVAAPLQSAESVLDINQPTAHPECAHNSTMNSAIKECPVCHALCFSDMDTCYGCLHHFSKEEDEVLSRPNQQPATTKTPRSHEAPLVPQAPKATQVFGASAVSETPKVSPVPAATEAQEPPCEHHESESEGHCAQPTFPFQQQPENVLAKPIDSDTENKNTPAKIQQVCYSATPSICSNDPFEVVISIRLPHA